MTTIRYRRRSINIDDVTHDRCRELAKGMTLSISGFLRILIKEAYEKQVETSGEHPFPSASGRHERKAARG